MTVRFIKLYFTLVSIFLGTHCITANAQGCSDAGFCTIGDLSHGADESKKLKIAFVLPVGRGDDGVLVVTPAVQMDNAVSDHLTLQTKLTFNYATGNLGSIAGFGDFYLSGSYRFGSSATTRISTTLGLKVPLSNGGLSVTEGPLPMQYQSSLGTLDLLIGATFSHTGWGLSVGYQLPLTGENGNQFLPSEWTIPDAINYPPTNAFDRQPDLLLRFSKEASFSNLLLNLGLLYQG